MQSCCLACGRSLLAEETLLAPCLAGQNTRLLGSFCRSCWLLAEIEASFSRVTDSSIRALATELLNEVYSLLQEAERAAAHNDARHGRHQPSASWSHGSERSRSRSRRR